MSVTYNQLVALLAVVDCGTFNRAASRLNLTQSTVTKRIQELEASMGFPIFDRSKQRAALTMVGEHFVSLARETVANFENLTSFTPAGVVTKTRVRLGVTELSSLTWLPKFLENSFTSIPDIEFDLTIDMSRNLVSSLDDGDLDIVVVPEMPFQANAHKKHLAGVEITLIAKPDLVPKSERMTVHELQGLDIITQGKSSGFSKSIREWFSNLGISSGSSVKIDSLHAMVGLAIAGRGFCIAPREYLEPLINSERLTEVQFEPKFPSINYCAVHYPTPHEALFAHIENELHKAVDFRTPYFR